jgi:hypothetical protein
MSGTTELKLEVGKRYRTRSGDVVAVINTDNESVAFPFVVNEGYNVKENGHFWDDGDFDCRDLVEEVTDEPEHDAINPPHYKQFPIEVIEVTQHLNFCLGNVIKYVLRCDYKGHALEDLNKAKWYLEREIMRRNK